jgi:hypothetical protein
MASGSSRTGFIPVSDGRDCVLYLHQDPVDCQPIANLLTRKRSEKPGRTRSTQESGIVDALDKQVESGPGRKSQGAVLIT